MAAGPEMGGRGGLSRRGLLKGAGAVGFAGVSLAALKLPFFGVDPAIVDPADCVATDVSATDMRADHLQLAGVHRPQEEGRVDAQRLPGAHRDHRRLHRRRQRQQRVLRQGEEPARLLPADRPRHDRPDRLDGRPDDLAGLDPAARQGEGAQPARQPDRAAAQAAVGPGPDLPRAVAERPDRHRLQRRQDRRGEELRGPDHPAGAQRQDHPAQRDARHDGLHAQGRRRRPEQVHRRRLGQRDRQAPRASSPRARSVRSPATSTSRTSRPATSSPARPGPAT